METFWNLHDAIVYKTGDPRIRRLPFLGTPYPVIILLLLYWIMVKQGPKWMQNRPAYNIKLYIQIYNIVQIIANASLAIVASSKLFEKSLRCLTHQTESDYDLTMVFYTWCYCMLKILDLCDTLFFVLRKKFQLLTTLHVYHHMMMVSGTILIARVHPGGEMAMMGIVNSFVHSIMYFYYFYCLQTENKQSLWWKKHITHLQLTQFIFFVFLYTIKLFQSGCNYPKSMICFALAQALIMVYMFGNYYYNAFIKIKDKSAKKL